MRKSTSFAEMMDVKRKTSTSQLSNSNASSKYTIPQSDLLSATAAPSKTDSGQ